MSEEKEHRAYQRDYIIHKMLMVLIALILCAIAYLGYEISNPKKPAPVLEDDLTAPTFYIAPDNRKELILEHTNE